jgi:hypothetical protein
MLLLDEPGGGCWRPGIAVTRSWLSVVCLLVIVAEQLAQGAGEAQPFSNL